MRLFGRFSNTMPFLWLWRTVKVNWQTPKYPMFTARMKILGRMDPLALFLPSWSPFCRETFGGKRISYDGWNFQWTNTTLVCRIWKQAKSRNLSDSAGTRFLQTSGRSKGTIVYGKWDLFSNFHAQWQRQGFYDANLLLYHSLSTIWWPVARSLAMHPRKISFWARRLQWMWRPKFLPFSENCLSK